MIFSKHFAVFNFYSELCDEIKPYDDYRDFVTIAQ